jgi:hypothetical protein
VRISRHNKTIVTAAAAFAVLVVTAVLGLGLDAALAQKAGGSVEEVGDNTAGFLQTIIGPLLLVVVGVFAFVALIRREAGMAIFAMGVGLVSGFFIYDPEAAEAAFRGIYNALF